MKLIHDHFQNFKRHNIPRAQLIIADIPYNVGTDAYGSNPQWYIDGDNTKGAGSGVTLLACESLGRPSYGFEIKREFCRAFEDQIAPSLTRVGGDYDGDLLSLSGGAA